MTSVNEEISVHHLLFPIFSSLFLTSVVIQVHTYIQYVIQKVKKLEASILEPTVNHTKNTWITKCSITHLYTCECLAILPNSLRESDIRGPSTNDLADITAVGSEKTAKSSTLSLPSSLGIWTSENYWHCHHAIITDL